MAVIDELSYEILIDIFSLLSTTDLGRVSRVSRRWHEICEPVLYKEPNLSDTRRVPAAIELFLRTLLAPGCERLASLVRVLNFQWLDAHFNVTPERKDIMDITAAAVSRIGAPNSCFPGSHSAHVVLLMHLLPRLRHLALEYISEEAFNDIMHGISPSNPIPLAFSSLTHFSYETSYLSVGVTPKALLLLLQLPYLRSLSVEVMVNIDLDTFTGVGGTSGVTKLCLSYCDISAASVSLILSVPRALEYFSYGGDCVVGFVDALLPLRGTLTHLHLDFGCTFDPAQMLNLREWPVLHTLRCSPALLLTDGRSIAQVLPRCIRRLGLLDFCDAEPWRASGEAVDAVVQLVGQKWMVPELERLFVENESMLDRGKVWFACEAAGVVLVDDCSSW